MRPLDEPIPPTERLFRCVGDHELYGPNNTEVLPAAIDLPDCSVSREKYCSKLPDDAIVPSRPGKPPRNRVVWMKVKELPASITDDAGQQWRFFAVDAPTEPRPVHAEIRVNKDSDSREGRKPNNKAVKKKLRKQLAAAMVLYTD